MSHLTISGSDHNSRYNQFSALEDQAMDNKANVTVSFENHTLTIIYDEDDVHYRWNDEVVTRGKVLEYLRVE